MGSFRPILPSKCSVVDQAEGEVDLSQEQEEGGMGHVNREHSRREGPWPDDEPEGLLDGDDFDDVDPHLDIDPSVTQNIYDQMPGGDVILTRNGPVGSALRVAEEINDQIARAYRESVARYAQEIDRPPPGVAILAEIKSIGEIFTAKNLASEGNVFLHLLARVTTAQAYIRKRSAPIHDAIGRIGFRLDGAMEDAVNDARKAAVIWSLHQQSITKLTGLIDVVRGYGEDIAEQIRMRGETWELKNSSREIERLLERIEARIFLLNNDADQIEAHVLRCREQVDSLRESRDYLEEMQHSMQMICLSANADSRARLLSDIRANRERLEVMSARIAKNAAVSAAFSRERGIISHVGIARINRIKESQHKDVAKIEARGDRLRGKRRELMREGYAIGVGQSRDRALDRMNRPDA